MAQNSAPLVLTPTLTPSRASTEPNRAKNEPAQFKPTLSPSVASLSSAQKGFSFAPSPSFVPSSSQAFPSKPKSKSSSSARQPIVIEDSEALAHINPAAVDGPSTSDGKSSSSATSSNSKNGTLKPSLSASTSAAPSAPKAASGPPKAGTIQSKTTQLDDSDEDDLPPLINLKDGKGAPVAKPASQSSTAPSKVAAAAPPKAAAVPAKAAAAPAPAKAPAAPAKSPSPPTANDSDSDDEPPPLINLSAPKLATTAAKPTASPAAAAPSKSAEPSAKKSSVNDVPPATKKAATTTNSSASSKATIPPQRNTRGPIIEELDSSDEEADDLPSLVHKDSIKPAAAATSAPVAKKVAAASAPAAAPSKSPSPKPSPPIPQRQEAADDDIPPLEDLSDDEDMPPLVLKKTVAKPAASPSTVASSSSPVVDKQPATSAKKQTAAKQATAAAKPTAAPKQAKHEDSDDDMPSLVNLGPAAKATAAPAPQPATTATAPKATASPKKTALAPASATSSSAPPPLEDYSNDEHMPALVSQPAKATASSKKAAAAKLLDLDDEDLPATKRAKRKAGDRGPADPAPQPAVPTSFSDDDDLPPMVSIAKDSKIALAKPAAASQSKAEPKPAAPAPSKDRVVDEDHDDDGDEFDELLTLASSKGAKKAAIAPEPIWATVSKDHAAAAANERAAKFAGSQAASSSPAKKEEPKKEEVKKSEPVVVKKPEPVAVKQPEPTPVKEEPPKTHKAKKAEARAAAAAAALAASTSSAPAPNATQSSIPSAAAKAPIVAPSPSKNGHVSPEVAKPASPVVIGVLPSFASAASSAPSAKASSSAAVPSISSSQAAPSQSQSKWRINLTQVPLSPADATRFLVFIGCQGGMDEDEMMAALNAFGVNLPASQRTKQTFERGSLVVGYTRRADALRAYNHFHGLKIDGCFAPLQCEMHSPPHTAIAEAFRLAGKANPLIAAAPSSSAASSSAPSNIKAPAVSFGSLPSFGGPSAPAASNPRDVKSKLSAAVPSAFASSSYAAQAAPSHHNHPIPGSIPKDQAFPSLSASNLHGSSVQISPPGAAAKKTGAKGPKMTPFIKDANFSKYYHLSHLKELPEPMWEDCQICLEDWVVGAAVATLHCGCRIHQHCLLDWLEKKLICPNHRWLEFKPVK